MLERSFARVNQKKTFDNQQICKRSVSTWVRQTHKKNSTKFVFNIYQSVMLSRITTNASTVISGRNILVTVLKEPDLFLYIISSTAKSCLLSIIY